MKPARKRRNESFLGIHFDFHTRSTHPVGTVQRPDIFEAMLDAVQPDYMQCDVKGHPGLASYPTKLGNAAPGICVDNLRMLRELTAKRGIALYGHYSGLYDIRAASQHPEWCVVDANGKRSDAAMSVFGGYVDELLIPQLLELALDYGLDGAWVDGDCWKTEVDYSQAACEAYRRETGRTPERPGAPGYEHYREFCREGFRRYVRRYITAVKAQAPDFQITSNWSLAAGMPEDRSVPIDFISGDYDASNSYASARYHSRCIMAQQLPWDLMAWGQNAPCSWLTDDRTTKEPNQYCQEAAVVLSLGGGFQFFKHQYDGGCLVQQWAIPAWQQVAQFCRAREPWCFGAQPIHQIGILHSETAHYAHNNALFSSASPAAKRVRGLIDLCAESQLPAEVLLTHQIRSGAAKDFGLILVPDIIAIEPDVRDALLDYARNGGSLLLCGPQAVQIFSGCGIEISAPEQKLTYIAHQYRMVSYQGLRGDFVAPDASEICGWYHNFNYFESPVYPMVVQHKLGTGSVAAVCFDLGDLYTGNRTVLIRQLFRSLADRLFPNRMLRLRGSEYADPTLMTKDGRILLNLTNFAGAHSDPNVRTFNEIPPVGPVEIELRLDHAPHSVTRQPEGADLSYTFADGILRCRVENIDIHTIVVIDP